MRAGGAALVSLRRAASLWSPLEPLQPSVPCAPNPWQDLSDWKQQEEDEKGSTGQGSGGARRVQNWQAPQRVSALHNGSVYSSNRDPFICKWRALSIGGAGAERLAKEQRSAHSRSRGSAAAAAASSTDRPARGAPAEAEPGGACGGTQVDVALKIQAGTVGRVML